jgi:hypothetical protein
MKYRLIYRLILFLAALLFICPPALSQEADSQKVASGIVKIYGMPISIQPKSNENPVAAPVPAVENPSTVPGGTGNRMTADEKIKYGLKRAFLSPGTYAFPVFATIRQQIDEDKPNKDTGDKVADGMSRYARNYGTSATKALLCSGVYPIVFKQNPHYEPSLKKGFVARVLHAASRVFVTRGDNGNQQFNYSQVVGSITASTLANAWERSSPGHDRIGVQPTFRRFGNMLLIEVVKSIVLKEFGSDIRRVLP